VYPRCQACVVANLCARVGVVDRRKHGRDCRSEPMMRRVMFLIFVLVIGAWSVVPSAGQPKPAPRIRFSCSKR
jgi:hypothetical protein